MNAPADSSRPNDALIAGKVFEAILQMMFPSPTDGILGDGTDALESLSKEDDARILLQAIQIAQTRLRELLKNGDAHVEYVYSIADTIEVTSTYKILVNGVEFPLPPLEKTVYILFLNHPEGIRFKDMASYEDEVRGIYGRISPGRMDDEISLAAKRITLCDDKSPLSIRKSKINARLSKWFDGELLEKIMISGQRGQAMKILVNRKEVIRNDDLVQLATKAKE